MDYLVKNRRRYQPRRILLSTEAVNAGITLPRLAWVISTMGVRRVYYDPRREIRVKVLASQTKASAVQEGGRCGRVFEGKHLVLATKEEMDTQFMVDDPPGIEMTKLDGLYLRLLKDLPRSVVEELPWMEPIDASDLEVVYDRLMTLSMITPGLAHTPPGVLSTGMELDPEQGLFLWNMILGGMPMEGLVWTTLIGKDLLQDAIHPDALNNDGVPGLRAGTPGWQPRYKDGSGELDDSFLNKWCQYVGVTSYHFVEFLEAFATQMKKMLHTLKSEVFEKHGIRANDPMLRSFRTPDHPLWGTCLTESLVRAGFQKLYVRSAMETMYTNPVSGCGANLKDTSLRYEPAIIVSLAQFQQQDGSINITSAVAVPEELLLEFD
eukprot:6490467-Amphidinium_carterae.1